MKALWGIIFIVFQLHAQEELTVVTRNSPTTYYFNSYNKAIGFEHDLIHAFAQSHNYKIKWRIKYSLDDVLQTLQKGQADLGASGLTHTLKRKKEFIFGPRYYSIKEKVVCGKGIHPKNIKELMSYRLEVIDNSSYIETLKKHQQKYSALQWKENKHLSTEAIFEKIHNKKMDCTISDSHIAAINQRYHPELNILFTIEKEKDLVWMMPKAKKSEELRLKLHHWFKTFKHSKEYVQIVDRYFSHTKEFNYFDIKTYHKRIKSKLPKYQYHFEKNSRQFKIPWKLLAAQAYQESHWNPYAKSPTGVRGMMMITLPTAKELGINNRLDYRQSIYAGAKYMNQLKRRLPKEIVSQVERYKFALAAYNIGFGHLEDAIALGKKYDIDPYIWINMKMLLPLLSQEKYYKELKYGYARGTEPVEYVTRINNYYQILKKLDNK